MDSDAGRIGLRGFKSSHTFVCPFLKPASAAGTPPERTSEPRGGHGRADVDPDPGVRDLEREHELLVARPLVLLNRHEPFDPRLVPELVEAELAPRGERPGGGGAPPPPPPA